MAAVIHSKDALEAVSVRLDNSSKLKQSAHSIGSACMVTVKTKGNKYRKEGMFGDEEFKFYKSYTGKSGALILCFKPVIDTSYFYIELKAEKLEETLPTFDEELTEMLGCDVMGYLNDYSEVYKEKEEAIALKEKQDSYGKDWGMF